MSEKSLRKMNGKDLAILIGVTDPNRYNHYDRLNGRTYVNREDIFSEKKSYTLPDDLRPVTDGTKFNSGEVWRDENYKIDHLYLGRSGDEDVTLCLGGEITYAGAIEIGKVDSGVNSTVYFDSQIISKG